MEPAQGHPEYPLCSGCLSPTLTIFSPEHHQLPGAPDLSPKFPASPGKANTPSSHSPQGNRLQNPGWRPRPRPSGRLLTGWKCRRAAGLTVPSSRARAASCGCSPAGEGGRRRVPGTGLPGRRAAAAAAPAQGRAAAPGVPTRSPGAAAPRRRGVRPPSSRGRDPREDRGWFREAADGQMPGGWAATRSPGRHCSPAREARGGNHATAGEGGGGRGRRAQNLTDTARPPRPATRRPYAQKRANRSRTTRLRRKWSPEGARPDMSPPSGRRDLKWSCLLTMFPLQFSHYSSAWGRTGSLK